MAGSSEPLGCKATQSVPVGSGCAGAHSTSQEHLGDAATPQTKQQETWGRGQVQLRERHGKTHHLRSEKMFNPPHPGTPQTTAMGRAPPGAV